MTRDDLTARYAECSARAALEDGLHRDVMRLMMMAIAAAHAWHFVRVGSSWELV